MNPDIYKRNDCLLRGEMPNKHSYWYWLINQRSIFISKKLAIFPNFLLDILSTSLTSHSANFLSTNTFSINKTHTFLANELTVYSESQLKKSVVQPKGKLSPPSRIVYSLSCSALSCYINWGRYWSSIMGWSTWFIVAIFGEVEAENEKMGVFIFGSWEEESGYCS